ncbi:MAG: hypothetical protein QW620_02455 [Thermoplasmata archaeon]
MYRFKGNYWSNWDGNDNGTANAYPIDGGVGASDWYPLGSPVDEAATLLPCVLVIAFLLFVARRRRIKPS